MVFKILSRVINKCKRIYRKQLFKSEIGCNHNDFNIVGDITVINKNIKLGRNVTIYPGVMFWGDGLIEIGDNVDIGKDTVIYSSKSGGVCIGNHTSIAAQCYIIDMDHSVERNSLIQGQENSVAPIHIGKDCWLAANVTVLKGSNIHDGAVIGAKSLVKGNCDAYGIYVGVPARKVKERI